MIDDFFLAFAGHAHTMNELQLDHRKELELKKNNSPEEAQKLTLLILDKLEKEISESGYNLKDVKLLILYSSYRGATLEKDTLICESILKAIESTFKKHDAYEVKLIGHTTCGELENEDLVQKQISGVGYNGLSILALLTNLPIGVGRTWGLPSAQEAIEQGKEMAHDAWVDLSQQASLKEQIHTGKTLLVLTQGSTVDTPGYEHFVGEGIASFMGSAREARIMNVIGGSSGDGLTAKLSRQFYGKLKEQPHFKVLEGESVCGLIPNLSEVSTGASPGTEDVTFGKQHTFYFDTEKEPHFKYVKSIDHEDPCVMYANMSYELETQISKEKGSPMIERKAFDDVISEAFKQQNVLIFNPALVKYAFAFPFGNYTTCPAMRVVGKDLELMFPIRSYVPEMHGYLITGQLIGYRGVRKEARRLYDMLRADQGFDKNDCTLFVSCINRRLVDLMYGGPSGSEAEVLKEGLSSTQVIGFLAPGEISFTHLTQEPYFHGFTCWGLTLHSKTKQVSESVEAHEPAGNPKILQGRIATGHPALDSLLYGGIPENYAVALTAPSCEQRRTLVLGFLRKGTEEKQVTFFLTTDPGKAKSIAESNSNFHLFVCNPQANANIRNQPNTTKLEGVENLTEIGIALSSAIGRLDQSPKGTRRMCIDLLSDILLQHHAVQTRRWLTALITELKSTGFTTLAVIDPQIHSSEELHAILGLFDGEINIEDKKTDKGSEKLLKINKMINQEHSEKELRLEH